MADKWMKDIKDCPRFFPTEEEFQHPLLYLETVKKKCEAEGAGTAQYAIQIPRKPPCELCTGKN